MPAAERDRAGWAALDPCVHCGFCLPACPTYLATGDESDSPRGRIMLMRALERGEIPANDPALVEHLDACLGCRGCEPVCPSGVAYGRGLETARETLARANSFSLRARAILAVFRRAFLWRVIFTLGRLLRATRIPDLAARTSFTAGMLASTEPPDVIARPRRGRSNRAARAPVSHAIASSAAPPRNDVGGTTVAVFLGCVMDTLFTHVHDATRRTLTANGYDVIEVRGQACCGALHEHAGDRDSAEALARGNVHAFAAAAERADFIVVNSAGCGAMLKDYGHLLGEERARAFAAKVRDVSELLAERGPRPGGALPLDVAYDAPCHLQHAQRVHAAPLAVLSAIPELRVTLLPGHDKCCGSAGIYSMLHPAMSRAVLDLKVAELGAAVPRPALVATGNPGCLMQIGAGLRAAGLPIGVAHPVELLDRSYRDAGLYISS
ncbi:MAG TPA: (Fe-S)-binding protein [Gemmatimonadales bacterium]|nr:(Fe-S)-binding protein [Gemmatimonadales bacterium]